MQKEVNIKYTLGHSYNKTYEKSEGYCPNCGKQEVWVELGDADFYEGPEHVCVGCKASFTLPSLTIDDGKEGEQLIKQLKEG